MAAEIKLITDLKPEHKKKCEKCEHNNCDDVDISAVDFFPNALYQDIFFDTFEAVKQYCPICKNIRK